MLSAFLQVSGGLFWIVVLIFLVAEVVASRSEELGAPVAILALAVVVLTLFSDFNVAAVIAAHWVLALLAVPFHFLAGAGWARLKWGGRIASALEDFDQNQAKWRTEYEERPRSDTWAEYVRLFHSCPPSAAENKERIVTWILFWPFSLIWSVLTYPRQFALVIYRRLLTAFERMATAAFADRLK